MSKGISSILSIALPIIGTAVAPGIGTALGSSLGTASLGAIGGALGGAAGGAISGKGIGGVVKGAALGGIGGYLSSGGLTDLGITGPGSILGEAASGLQGPTQSGASLGAGSGILGKVTSYLPSMGGGSNIGTLLTAGNAVSGVMGANAAAEAGDLQYKASMEAINQGNALRAPYVQAGSDAQGRYTELLTNPQAQLDFVQNNPFYQSLADDAKRRLLASQATKGKIASGGTASALQTELLNLGTGLVNNQLSGLQNTAAQGANVATGQATDVGNLLTGGAAAQAAGKVGAVNAGTGAYQNTVATLLALKRLNQGGDLLKNTYSPAL